VPDSLVIIPTYNEKENIERMIRKVFSLDHPFHLLIVDDGSPDGTQLIVKDLQNVYPDSLFMLQRPGKQGLGTAYIDGFKWAIEHQYDYIFEMDADFSHNPEDLVKLRSSCVDDNADMSVGSRYINGVNVVNWPMGRVLMSYFASVYVRFITGINIQDFTAGFVCYKRNVLETIQLNKIKFVGYAFQIEMKYTAVKHGFKVVEVPIIFTDRTAGTSKMSRGIFKEAVWGVIQMKINSIFRKYPEG
jgi:dolichol-phosphate mannosyltransferase